MLDPRSAHTAGERVSVAGPQPGDLLDGKYRLERLLGTGGMGWVYEARNEALDASVAVKVIRTDLGRLEQLPLADRLLQEARAAAQLGHPAITRVYDFGVTPAGHPYLVMELLTGDDLASVLRERATVKPSKAVQTLLPIAHALATAHSKGIVHRDVKPSNIFLSKTDSGMIQPKLIDFGVAKLERRAVDRVTLVGFQVGSPGYMSPEQARGEDAGPGADVWALGVVLYEMLTGRLPFAGDNYNALMRAIIEDPHVPLSLVGVADGELGALIDRSLAKRASERWSSVSELGVALARWLVDRGYAEDISSNSLAATWLSPRIAVRASDALDSIAPPGSSRNGPRSVHRAEVPPVGAPWLAPPLVPTFFAPTTRTSIPVVASSAPVSKGTASGMGRWLPPSIVAGALGLAAVAAWLTWPSDRDGERRSPALAAEGADETQGRGYLRVAQRATVKSLARRPRPPAEPGAWPATAK